MPPCGYRGAAVDGLDAFLSDNLQYFIELYRGRGLTIAAALASEAKEIDLIRSGARGGPWSTRAVELNDQFYKLLADAQPQTWSDVERIGREIIAGAVTEFRSLLPGATSIAAE